MYWAEWALGLGVMYLLGRLLYKKIKAKKESRDGATWGAGGGSSDNEDRAPTDER